MQELQVMGYRSDVGFACDPIIKQVIETMGEWDSEFKELLDYGEDLADGHDQGRYRWESVKWYESFPDVQVVENIMSMCDNCDINGLAYDSYGFIRIGEELDDVEMKGDTCAFDLYINRSLDI
tara:strand:- start:253 stop:621 length:369 start_codon:yes stop_codon:yes gene_type:complete